MVEHEIKELERMIEVILRSIRKEHDARDLYLATARRAPTEMTRILFERLAKQEQEHEKKLHAAMDILREEIDNLKHTTGS